MTGFIESSERVEHDEREIQLADTGQYHQRACGANRLLFRFLFLAPDVKYISNALHEADMPSGMYLCKDVTTMNVSTLKAASRIRRQPDHPHRGRAKNC